MPPPPVRPYVPRDPNAGPRVDSEPVWLYLELCEREEAVRRTHRLPLDVSPEEQEQALIQAQAAVSEANAPKRLDEQGKTADKQPESSAAEAPAAPSATAEKAQGEAEGGVAMEDAPAKESQLAELRGKDKQTEAAKTKTLEEEAGPPVPVTVAPVDSLPRHLIGMDKGRPVRHLGSWLYDPTVDPLFPAELLHKNIGATIEVRVSGDLLVPHGRGGPSWNDYVNLEREALARCEIGEPLQAFMDSDKGRAALEGTGNGWKLGWRGKEHARMSLEMRIEERVAEKHLFREKLSPVASAAAEKKDGKNQAGPGEAAALQKKRSSRSSPWQFWRLQPLLRRKLWGTDVYTDDSDVLAMCVHAGWVEGPSLVPEGIPAWVPPGRAARAWTGLDGQRKANLGSSTDTAATATATATATDLGANAPCDLSVILRIAPKLIAYKGCQRSGLKSRSWGNTHDGVSLVVESVELRQPGYALHKGRRNAKSRMDQMQQLRLAATLASPRVPDGVDDATLAQVWKHSAPHGVGLVSLKRLVENEKQAEQGDAVKRRRFWDAQPAAAAAAAATATT